MLSCPARGAIRTSAARKRTMELLPASQLSELGMDSSRYAKIEGTCIQASISILVSAPSMAYHCRFALPLGTACPFTLLSLSLETSSFPFTTEYNHTNAAVLPAISSAENPNNPTLWV